jgi:hypothetical protein
MNKQPAVASQSSRQKLKSYAYTKNTMNPPVQPACGENNLLNLYYDRGDHSHIGVMTLQ